MSQAESVASFSRLDNMMRWASKLLVFTVWGSAMLFGLYILVFYFLALLQGNTEQWNQMLPGLFDRETRAATISIGIHFAGGGIILILGCIQLIEKIRLNYPALHRWLGRLYVIAALATAIGGLLFIFLKGTIGGIIMDIGFGGYGILTFIAAVATILYARKGDFVRHRAWAIRLFALAIGSWIYRMDYGFWFLVTGGLGHAVNFSGPFDYFMDFFFYLPNLIVAEIFIGRYKITKAKTSKGFATICLFVASVFIILATYYFTKYSWGPPLVKLISGQ